ncbi:hypothetical protein BU24DRAFT_418988 [Aaosphaeria arxii CBS 175.79]|uniref:Uncharacterized protein n=1 Tax=Aaosphaeria arxii CBS 175.79 TaxID=1450172 RepID=A0A6A5Y2C1_9PLEO|nr:uncharacterized protein BU24DRAFT_418988 [Aaosphaeria arxii CBS 175.79]KAF2019373.1 hypothetical protein BU24DRAFT_418988 [Aaosphaeria arxii CBS 175.79]
MGKLQSVVVSNSGPDKDYRSSSATATEIWTEGEENLTLKGFASSVIGGSESSREHSTPSRYCTWGKGRSGLGRPRSFLPTCTQCASC